MLKLKHLLLLPFFAAATLLSFTGCGDDDNGSDTTSAAWLAAETVNAETTSGRIDTRGRQGLTYVAAIVEQGGTEWCSFDVFPDAGGAILEKEGEVGGSIYLALRANESEENRVATIEVAFSDGYAVSLRLTQIAHTSSAQYDRLWGEQPAFREGDAYVYKTYYTTLVKGGYVRNYSICYDLQKRVANWVAYPLQVNYVNPSVNRTNDWAYDPNTQLPEIPRDAQQYIIKSYGSGDARGHQCPSADRYSTEATNAMTFYATNMMPQHYGFNGGIWAQLENKIRSNMIMHSRDTIFVVTGTYFGDNRYITDQQGNRIGYPSNCWKVLLRASNGKAVWNSTADELRGIGFWFSNSGSNTESLRSYATTIDDIERKTGFRFFRNLPADAAAAVKKQKNPSDWGL